MTTRSSSLKSALSGKNLNKEVELYQGLRELLHYHSAYLSQVPDQSVSQSITMVPKQQGNDFKIPETRLENYTPMGDIVCTCIWLTPKVNNHIYQNVKLLL